MRMPRYLTLFCWLIGLPSISIFKELSFFDEYEVLQSVF